MFDTIESELNRIKKECSIFEMIIGVILKDVLNGEYDVKHLQILDLLENDYRGFSIISDNEGNYKLKLIFKQESKDIH